MKSSNTVRHNATVTRARRELLNGHKGAVVWFTGLSGAGKSTLAHTVEERLHRLGCRTYVLDGDNIRHGLCGDLGFSPDERSENVRRIAEVCKLFVDAGMIVLAAFITPFERDRQRVRKLIGPDYSEVYCRCALEIYEQRDEKGLYQRARAGEIEEFTGISSPYEEPTQAHLALDTGTQSLGHCADQVMDLLRRKGIIAPERARDAGSA